MNKWILFVAAILTLCSSVVSADAFKDAMEAYRGGNYTEALELLRPLADQGNTDAQYNLGVMYAEGKGVKQDHREAEKWYLLAAEQGNASAE